MKKARALLKSSSMTVENIATDRWIPECRALQQALQKGVQYHTGTVPQPEINNTEK